MNKQLFSILAMLCIALSCIELNAISVIPVKRDSASKWCFINAKGKFYLENRYEGKLFYTDEETFAVYEKDSTWTVYKFDKKNPRMIASNLHSIGNFSEGFMAVMRHKDAPIEIIDKKGKTVLTLDSFDEKVIIDCGYCHYGSFVVTVIDEMGNMKKGAIALSGKELVAPVDDELFLCANDNIIGKKDSKIFMSDGKGGYRTFAVSGEEKVYRFGKYVVADANSATLIFDQNTMKMVATLPMGSFVNDIYKNFVEYGLCGGHYVYDLTTKKTLPFEKCDRITLTKKGIIAGDDYYNTENYSFNLYSYNGQFVRKTGWTDADRCGNFVVASQLSMIDWEPRQYLLDENLKLIKDYNFAEISTPFSLLGDFEYSPHKAISVDMVSSIMVNNIHPALVDLGVIEGKTANDIPPYKNGICYHNGQMIDRQTKKGEGDVITLASLVYLSADDDNSELKSLYIALCAKMDKLYKKVADGVYEDDGIYYYITEDCELHVSLSPQR